MADALLQAEVVRKGKAGILSLTPTHVILLVDSEKAYELPVASLKKFFVNTTGVKALLKVTRVDDGIERSDVFEFTGSNGRSVLNTFVDILAQLRPATSKPSKGADARPRGSVSGSSAKATAAVPQKDKGPVSAKAKQQAALLKANPQLRALHHELVDGKVITNDEFWEVRASMLLRESSRPRNQESGIPSALLADLQPTLESSTKVLYSLTRPMIELIFRDKPAVRRAYKANVPHKMDEKTFWKKYFQSQQMKGAPPPRKDSKAAKEKDVFADVDKEARAPPVLAGQKRRLHDPLNSLASLEGDARKGFGTEELGPPSKRQKLGAKMISEFNAKSALLLTDQPAGQEGVNADHATATDNHERYAALAHDSVRMDDLEGEDQDQFIPLDIVDQRASRDISCPTVANGEERRLVTWRPVDLSRGFAAPDTARAVLAEIDRRPNTDGSTVDPSTAPHDVQQKLMAINLTADELLRHFWLCLRGGPMSPEVETKFTRVHARLVSLTAELKQLQLEIYKGNSPQHGNLLLPLRAKLDAAAQRYDQEVPKLAGKGKASTRRKRKK